MIVFTVVATIGALLLPKVPRPPGNVWVIIQNASIPLGWAGHGGDVITSTVTKHVVATAASSRTTLVAETEGVSLGSAGDVVIVVEMEDVSLGSAEDVVIVDATEGVSLPGSTGDVVTVDATETAVHQTSSGKLEELLTLTRASRQ